VKGSIVNHVQSPRALNGPAARNSEPGFFGSFGRYFKRMLDEDMIVLGDGWL
jgi:hypothetical protein